MTTAKRPDLPEFLALTFSPKAASALTETNALARQLRDMPANLLTDQISDDRDRVLGEHLADLLAAHRDARATGATSADSELVEGLEHVREELARIIGACRARANDTLTTQRSFLEARYPAAADDMLAALPAVPATVEAKPVADANGEHRKLTADALDALLPPKARPSAPTPRKPPAPAPEWWHRAYWNGTSAVAVIMALIVAVGLLGSIVYGVRREMEEAAIAKAFPLKVAVVIKVDSVKRSKHPDIYGMDVVAVGFHGTIANKADREALQVRLAIDLSACPEDSPAASCKVIDTTFYDPTVEATVPAGLTTRFRHTEEITIPDIDGEVRARVRLVGVSPFGEFRN